MESNEDYVMGLCGTFWLRYSGKNNIVVNPALVRGFIRGKNEEEVQVLPYSEFKKLLFQ